MDFTKDQIMANAPDLMPYLPDYYQNSEVVKNQIYVESYEVGKLVTTLKDIEDQLYIDRATWGLSIYEKKYGITPNPNATYDERREIIKAHKRGIGTSTKAMIQNTAQAFSSGEVEIIEHPETFSFTVKFVGTKGIPQNMDGFTAMLRAIKPAHLGFDFEYTYTVWSFVEGNSPIWSSLGAKTWDEMKTY